LAGSPVTPNHITALSLIAGLAGALLFAQGGTAMHWGALLFILSTLLDHADGELARMTGQTSRFGHIFDILVDGLTHVALFLGMGYGLRDTLLGAWAMPMGIAAGLAVVVIFALRFELERRSSRAAVAQPSFGGFEVEDIMYLVGPITWLGGLVPFLALASIGAPAFLVYQAWEFRVRRA
jgi:phosphatidylglycerophosphate synthase